MNPAPEKHSALVGICPKCEHVVFAAVISHDPIRLKENAREVDKLIRAGFRIETWDDMDRVRSANWMCECPKVKKGRV